jgi:pimeloyl-ACP methyl ester carboxylesterase
MTSPFEGRISPLHQRLSQESLARFLPMALEYAQKVADLSPQGRLIQVPDVTHHFPLERPDLVVETILEILAEAR